MKTAAVPLREIDLLDNGYCTSFMTGMDPLILSMKTIGMVHPPSLARRDSRYVVISGWKRVAAAGILNFDRITARIFDKIDDLDALLIGLYDNLSHRELSAIEKAEVIIRLKRFGVRKKDIVRCYFPLLEIPSDPRLLESYHKAAEMEEEIKKVLHARNLSIGVLEPLLRFSSEVRRKLLPFISSLGQNKSRELLENLWELSAREGKKPDEILANQEIADIFEEDGEEMHSRALFLRRYLNRRRYPTLHAWKIRLEEKRHRLNWPEGMDIVPSSDFGEGPWRFNFTFSSPRNFEEKLEMLKKLAKQKDFVELLRELNGGE